MKLNHSHRKHGSPRSLLKTFACDFNPKGGVVVVVWGCRQSVWRGAERAERSSWEQLAAYKGSLVLP